MKTLSICVYLLVVVARGALGEEGEELQGGWGSLGQGVSRLVRERRSALKKNTAIAGFSWEERVELIRLHNAARRKPGASNMRHITWSTEAEKKAQDWVADCNTGHSSGAYRKTSTFNYLGENLFGGTGGYREEGIVAAWDNEKQYYSNFNCQANKACGHYTQVVWADTYVIGCGIKFCDPWYRVSCVYGPGGNIGGQNPFQVGAACSACPTAATTCDNGLCRPGDCYGKSCKNGGNLLQDVCECNCTATDYSGETCEISGNAAGVVSPVPLFALLTLAAMALQR